MKKAQIIDLKETQLFITNRSVLLLGFQITTGIFIVSSFESVIEITNKSIVSSLELTAFILVCSLIGTAFWIINILKIIMILNAEKRIKLNKSKNYYKKHKMNISKMYKRYTYCRGYFLTTIVLLLLITLIALYISN